MRFRTMQCEDYDEVYALWLSCSGMGLNNLDDSREGIAVFLNRNPQTCFVAAEEEKIVGAIMVGSDGRRGYIYHTAVHPDYRRRGIGKALVERALQALKEIGIHKVAMVVFRSNLDGNLFWEKLGFTIREDLVYRNMALAQMERLDT